MSWAESLRLAGLAAVAVALLGACSQAEPVSVNTESNVPAPADGVSASQLMDSIIKAGLPAPNLRDTTAVKCPKLQCEQAIDTDTVSILEFPTAGPARLYADAISNVYQVKDVVLTFAPTVTTERKHQYEQIVDRTQVASSG